MAEINGLLNRRTTLKLYRGFESLPHRSNIKCSVIGAFLFGKYLKRVQPNSLNMKKTQENIFNLFWKKNYNRVGSWFQSPKEVFIFLTTKFQKIKKWRILIVLVVLSSIEKPLNSLLGRKNLVWHLTIILMWILKFVNSWLLFYKPYLYNYLKSVY